MAWETPKTDWQSADPVTKDDMNRIEGNTDFLKNANTDVHGIEMPYYVAKTSRSDQLPDWADIQNKPFVNYGRVTNLTVYPLSNHLVIYFNLFDSTTLLLNGNAYTDGFIYIVRKFYNYSSPSIQYDSWTFSSILLGSSGEHGIALISTTGKNVIKWSGKANGDWDEGFNLTAGKMPDVEIQYFTLSGDAEISVIYA